MFARGGSHLLKSASKSRGSWKNVETQRAALERFGREHLGVKELDDWYAVKATDVHHEFSFLYKNYGSLVNALKKFYPQHDWDPLRFSRVPHGYWADENTQRDALERLGRQKLGVKELDDWYAVSADDVYSELSFTVNYYESLYDALKKLYPQHKWDPHRFSRVPSRFWTEDKQRDALERFGREHLGVKELDDWYAVSSEDLHNKSELGFIRYYYNGSLCNALKKLYPQHNWNFLRFGREPKIETAQRDELERIGRERFGVKELNDWYSVSARDVKRELSFIRECYGGSLFKALKKMYPQHNWNPSRFPTVVQTQRIALERLGREKFGVKELNDWYSVSTGSVKSELSFMNKYGSLYDALKKFYPQHNWDPLRFSRVPPGYWADENTQRDALERVGREQFGVKELDDWYSVPAEEVKNELSFIRSYYNGNMYSALKKLYPQYNWDPLRFSRLPPGYWQQTSVVQHYRLLFTEWKTQHNIRTVRDWYELAPQQVSMFRRAAKGIFGSNKKLLSEWFPEIVWHSQFVTELELQAKFK